MAETLNETRLRLETLIQENFADVDIAPGTVFSELIVKMAAFLQNPIKNETDALNQAKTVEAVLASEEDTFSPIIDGIASNYNTSRGQGKTSVGKIKVVVQQPRTQTIRQGFTFFQPVLKLNYVVPTEYRITQTPTEANDIQIVAEGALYYFIIPVEAAAVGSEYQVSDKGKFSVAEDFNLLGFVDAYAYGNFTSGLPADSDKALIAKYQQGIANKSLLNQKSILFRLSEQYPNVRDLSVIGANDREMTRSKQNLFGISTLGMADVYVRSSLGPETVRFTKTATKVGTAWEINLNSDDVPGFYRVISVVPAGQDVGGTLVFSTAFNFSTMGILPVNVVNDAKEGRFTKYQTCKLTIQYNAPSSAATEQDFDILVSYQPNVADIQNLFLSIDERIACADYLVKAALPCYVSVALKVRRKNINVELPIDKIKQDIYNYINSLKFGEDLYASELVKICHNYDVKQVDFPVRMTGSIFGTDGSITTIEGNNVLTIPTKLDVGISPKTTLFFADYFKADAQDNMSESIDIKVN